MAGDSTWVGKKPLRRIGGMSDALSIASDLGFTVAPPPSQVGNVPRSSFSRSRYFDENLWMYRASLPKIMFAMLAPAGLIC